MVAAALLAGSCRSSEDPGGVGPTGPSGALFVERAEALGVDFVHRNGMTGEFLYPEMMGSGAAVLDYDGDGDLDIYLVQGGALGEVRSEARPPADRLYRNDWSVPLEPGAGWRFVDVTARAGATSRGYGMGVAVEDYDGDGWPDLYVTNLGPNSLLRNRGDGTFEDRTAASGAGDDGWGVPAVFFDLDQDLRPDLYVGNYLEYTTAMDVPCFDTLGARDYCGPTAYLGARDRLFRNLGGGRFEDVSASSGVGRRGRTLGALAADFDGDGAIDLYVANDGEANYLWLNGGDGTFAESALLAGSAVDGVGRPQASMGLAAGDYDRDGDPDLLVTHLTGEFNTLYDNAGAGRFEDRSQASGLGLPSLPLTGFGVAWIDFDGDGWQDLLTLNGAVKSLEAQRRLGDPYPLRQPKQLFRNRGDGSFEELSQRAGEAIRIEGVGRGLAVGDLDGDGDEDAVGVYNSAPAEVLLNPRSPGRRFVGVAGLRTGARVVLSAPGLRLAAWPRSDGSYAAARDARVLFGLGSHSGSVDLQVELPRRRLLLRAIPAGRYVVVSR